MTNVENYNQWLSLLRYTQDAYKAEEEAFYHKRGFYKEKMSEIYQKLYAIVDNMSSEEDFQAASKETVLARLKPLFKAMKQQAAIDNYLGAGLSDIGASMGVEYHINNCQPDITGVEKT